MKIIKKIFLVVLTLFAFTACFDISTVQLTGNVAPVKASQKKVIVANYSKNPADVRDILNTNLKYDGWEVTNISFWEVDEINYKKRSETFLIVVDKVRSNGLGFFDEAVYDGHIMVYDLRTRNLIIKYRLYREKLYTATNKVVKALNKLVVK